MKILGLEPTDTADETNTGNTKCPYSRQEQLEINNINKTKKYANAEHVNEFWIYYKKLIASYDKYNTFYPDSIPMFHIDGFRSMQHGDFVKTKTQSIIALGGGNHTLYSMSVEKSFSYLPTSVQQSITTILDNVYNTISRTGYFLIKNGADHLIDAHFLDLVRTISNLEVLISKGIQNIYCQKYLPSQTEKYQKYSELEDKKDQLFKGVRIGNSFSYIFPNTNRKELIYFLDSMRLSYEKGERGVLLLSEIQTFLKKQTQYQYNTAKKADFADMHAQNISDEVLYLDTDGIVKASYSKASIDVQLKVDETLRIMENEGEDINKKGVCPFVGKKNKGKNSFKEVFEYFDLHFISTLRALVLNRKLDGLFIKIDC